MEKPSLPTEKAHNNKVTYCKHCNSVTDGGDFCCPGCQTAHNIIENNNTADKEINDLSNFATLDDNQDYKLILSVEGITCISCVKLIEDTLLVHPLVTYARVNMSTKRLVICWNGEKEDGSILAGMIAKLGYGLRPFNNDTIDYETINQKKLLLRAIAVSGFAMGNIMMISISLWSHDNSSMGTGTRDFLHFISALIAIPAIIYSGRPFFSSALNVLKNGHTNMDVPISLAVILAGGMSLLETVNHGDYIYFDSVVMLLFFLLIGRYLDLYAKGKAREHAKNLLSMLNVTATIVENGKLITISANDLRKDMLVLVATGETIPADGIITKGASDLDMSLITGESIPCNVKIGDNVFAGTTNLTSPIYVKVTKIAEDSLLGNMVNLMEKAEQGKALYVRIADRAARLYTPVIHIVGILTFLGWLILIDQPWQVSLLNAITVLIITCPCALGLAVPVVQVLACSKLMKQGVLLKSSDALERLAIVDTIIFDKTGTLTTGNMNLLKGKYTANIMQLAASLGSNSKHPLSRAISNSYKGKLLEINDIQEIAGKGIKGIYNGKEIRLGSMNWCGGDMKESDNVNKESQITENRLWFSFQGDKATLFRFEDQLRKNVKSTIKSFNKYNIHTILLSGDVSHIVKHVSGKVGIKEYYAAYSPIEKCNFIKNLKLNNKPNIASRTNQKKILMVGDGLNDAPALNTANISMSPSTAVDITQNAADIVFQGNDLSVILTSWKISRFANILVKQNFLLTILYNLIAIPIAVMGYVTPLIAALSMSLSSLIVIGNSYRLNLGRKE